MLEESGSASSKSGDAKAENSKPRGYKWLLNSMGKFLAVTICLTFSYVVFLLADALVLFIIGYLVRDLITKYDFVQNGFEGVRIFSAIVIGLMYLFHLLYATYDQVRFVIRVFRRVREEEEEQEKP